MSEATQVRRLVYLATSRDFAEGEPGFEVANAAFAARNIEVEWICWDDPTADWSKADLVAVRSTWDYQTHLPKFLQWAESIGDKLLHGAHVFSWNTDKCYLQDLEATGVPTVPSRYASTLEELRELVSEKGKFVVKPAIGSSGDGVEVVENIDVTWRPSWQGPWIIQPFLESVMTEGETSVFMIDGKITAQLSRKAAEGEFRVHEHRGGHSKLLPVTQEAELIALQTMVASESILKTKLSYARFDLLRMNGHLVTSEVEITEPQLYFDLIPEHAEIFAAMVERYLSAGQVHSRATALGHRQRPKERTFGERLEEPEFA